jgi:hypothetical protein
MNVSDEEWAADAMWRMLENIAVAIARGVWL